MVSIDYGQWPRLMAPTAPRWKVKRRSIEATFPDFHWKHMAGSCGELSPGRLPLAGTPAANTVYLYDAAAVNERLHQHGWLGFAESFMAGEWDAHDPSYIWEAFLKKSGHFSRLERTQRKQPLVAQPRQRSHNFDLTFVDDTLNIGAADFVNGPRSTTSVGGVKEVYLDDPSPLPLRKDLFDAQRRRTARVLLDADLRRGDNVLFIGAEWGETALEAVGFGCSVTVLCPNEELERVLSQRVLAAEVGQIRLIPGLYSETGLYDVIISVSPHPRDDFFEAIVQLAQTDLKPGGRLVVERPWRGAPRREMPLAWWWAYVDTETQLRSREECISALEPAGLRLIQSTHAEYHYLRSLELWDESFRANVAELGALGYDAVYRRLWRTTLAITRAALRTDSLSYQRMVFRKRSR